MFWQPLLAGLHTQLLWLHLQHLTTRLLQKNINTDLLLSVTNINLLVNFSNNVSRIAFMYGGFFFDVGKYTHHIHTIRYMLRQSVPVILFLYNGYVPWHAFNNILIASWFRILSKPVFKGQPRWITKVAFADRWPLFRTSESYLFDFHGTNQDWPLCTGNHYSQVSLCTGLTVPVNFIF